MRLAAPILVFLALCLVPLWVSGGAFLSSDETLAFTQMRAVAETGSRENELPYFDDVGPAFASMGSGVNGASVEGGVSPLFVGIYAPAAAFGPTGVAAMTSLFGVLLLASAFVIVREAADLRAATITAWLLAASPPLLFWSTFAMANVPTTAVFVASLAAFALYLRSERTAWLVASVVLLVAAAAMRRDSLPLAIPGVALLLVAGHRRPIIVVAALVGAYGSFAGFRASMGLASSLGDAVLLSASDVAKTWDLVLLRYGSYHPGWTVAQLAANVEAYALAVWGVVALGVALVPLARPETRKSTLVLATLVASALAYFFVSMTITEGIVADPPGVFSSLVRYALLAPVAAACLLGIVFGRARLLAGRRAVALTVALLVVAGGVQSVTAEPGIGWSTERRLDRVEIQGSARLLPPNAILVGDEISKYVVDVPVLAPNNLWPTPERWVLPMIDRLADRHGTRAYIHYDTYQGDWTGVVGEAVTDEHHVTRESGVGDFLEILWTNTSLANVGILTADEWTLDADARLVTHADMSRFRPTPVLAKDLTEAPAPGVRIRAVVVQEAGAHAFGYVNAPGTPNDVRVLHAWDGPPGAIHAFEVFLPADTIVNGPFFLSGGLILLSLHVDAMPGVVEP